MRIQYCNGKIFTSDPENPYGEAMVVQDGRIVWVGGQTGLPGGPYDGIVDLQGRRVLPQGQHQQKAGDHRPPGMEHKPRRQPHHGGEAHGGKKRDETVLQQCH